MNPILLDRRDSAKYLGISVSNLDRLRAAGNFLLSNTGARETSAIAKRI